MRQWTPILDADKEVCGRCDPVSVVEGNHTHRVNDLILDASKKRVLSRVGHSASFILAFTKIVEIIDNTTE